MAATLYGTPTGGFAYSGTSVAVTVPGATAGYGQTVVLSIQDDYSPVTVTAPAGWTLQATLRPGEGSISEDAPRSLIYTKTASATVGDATETWTLSSSKQHAWGAWATTEPFSIMATTTVAGPSTSWVAPAVTCPTVAATDALWVQVVLPAWYARTGTPPGGTTEMTQVEAGADSGSYCGVTAGYKAVGTGSTGTGTWTMNDSGKYSAASIIYSAVAGGSTITISGGGSLSFDQPQVSTDPSAFIDEEFIMLIKISEATAARRRVKFRCVDATDGFTAEPGLTFAASEIKVSKNGGTEANYAGTVAEIGSGRYYYVFDASEIDTAGFVQVRISKSGVRDTDVTVQVISVDLNNTTSLGLTNLAEAVLDADGIADAILLRDDGVETGITVQEALRYIGAMLAGKITGAGSGTETFYAVGNASTPRVIHTVDSNKNRTATTLS